MNYQQNSIYQEFQTQWQKLQVGAVPLEQQQTQLENIRTEFLGKKGPISAKMRELGALTPEERGQAGKLLNELREAIEAQITERKQELAQLQLNNELQSEWMDTSLTPPESRGTLHPISQVQQQIENLFVRMGFTVLDGPHIELDHYNFEALNIPKNHPARDMQDTFYFGDGTLLRTHTSSIQVRGMELLKPPIRIIGPGKVFRCERTDASHESAFHQLEGMLIDQNITVGHLIHFMRELLAEVFGQEVEVRLRPGYFPFVEPGFELDVRCLICGGTGCSVCKQVGWLELLPCGMIHPHVLRACDIDPQKYNGFAFGLGLDRIVMMNHKIPDIRYFHGNDIRFLNQF